MANPGVYSVRLEIPAGESEEYELPRLSSVGTVLLIPGDGGSITIEQRIHTEWIPFGYSLDAPIVYSSRTFFYIKNAVTALRFNAIGGAAVVEIAL